jgi:putative endonuclease
MPGVDHRQQRGRRGEQVAEEFLRARGYVILARNYRVSFGEVDIIAQDRQTLVFVEVRTHTGEAFGDPLASVNVRKQRQIAKAAWHYLARNGLLEREARFDVVGIRWENEQARLTHIKNAFELPRSW